MSVEDPPLIRVVIVGDHPHKGATGVLTRKTITFPWGTKMFEVEFDDDFGRGDSGCFAEAKNLRQITC